MKRALLACAVLASCSSPAPAVRGGPAVPTSVPTSVPTTTSTSTSPTSTSTSTALTTTSTSTTAPTTVPITPEGAGEADAPAPSGPTVDPDDMPSPQGRSTGRGAEPPAGDVWSALADCESGGDPTTNTGNGYYGAFQFSLPTWRSVGESGLPSAHSYAHQLAAARRLQARSGWGQWPACSRMLGLV